MFCQIRHMLSASISATIIMSVCNVLATEKEEFVCSSAGKFAHEDDPTKYHECYFLGGNNFTHLEHNCPQDNCFVSSTQSCLFVDGNCGTSENATMSSNSLFPCPHSGKFAHPDPSRKGSFIRCVEAQNQLFAYEYQCLPTKPCYSETKMRCVEPTLNSSLVINC